MVTKRTSKAEKRVKDLRAKDTSAKQAKGIKGGEIVVINTGTEQMPRKTISSLSK